MKIKSLKGTPLELSIFQGEMWVHIAKPPIEEKCELVKMGNIPAIRTYTNNREKVLIPIDTKIKEKIKRWYEFHTSEEAVACNWNHEIF